MKIKTKKSLKILIKIFIDGFFSVGTRFKEIAFSLIKLIFLFDFSIANELMLQFPLSKYIFKKIMSFYSKQIIEWNTEKNKSIFMGLNLESLLEKHRYLKFDPFKNKTTKLFIKKINQPRSFSLPIRFFFIKTFSL